ncbi:MAG: hypothetical protein AB8B99_19305 [Phormidesmis sp.]
MERPAENFLQSIFVKDIRKVLAPEKVAATTQATVQRVHCPTCGSYAERYHQHDTIRTQCAQCDYLMTICTETGRVLEAYAPSFTPAAVSLMA